MAGPGQTESLLGLLGQGTGEEMLWDEESLLFPLTVLPQTRPYFHPGSESFGHKLNALQGPTSSTPGLRGNRRP